MIEYEQQFLGYLYCLSVGGTFVTHKNGNLRTWRTMAGAQKAALAFPDASVRDVRLSMPMAVKPILVPANNVLELLDELVSAYATGLPRTTICSVVVSDNVNVIRHTPLGQKHVREVGDTDTVVDVRLKYYVDCASMVKIEQGEK